MVWSNWRGALVVVAAWVGLAWTQAYTQSSGTTPVKAERIMTLYENGKAIRCRVVGSWPEANGTAYQLQSLDNGELITIVETGPAASAPSEGRRTVRTRNFHWGLLNRNPPRGCPTPPTHVMAACDNCGPGSGHVVAADGRSSVVHTGPSVVVSSNPIPEKDEVVWWEEKDGKRVSPTIVTQGPNPFEEGPTLPGVPLPTGPDHIITTTVMPTPETRIVTAPRMAPTRPTFSEIELPVPVARTNPSLPGNKRFGDRIRDFFSPQPAGTKVVTAARELPGPTPWKTETSATTTIKPLPPRVPFSTAAVATPKTPAGKPTPRPLTMADEDKGGLTLTKGVEPPKTPKTPTDETPKKDWRTMWGQGENATVQQPGMSLMQVAVKPGKGPWSGGPQAIPTEASKDILLNPERFDPSASRYTPKGVDAASGVRNPYAELPPVTPYGTPHVGISPGSVLPPTGSLPPPVIPATMPMGSSSVIAAKSGIYGQVTYIPVPVTTVPTPTHPPMPPPPRVPEPPNPTYYLNAFTPSTPPQAMASAPQMPQGMPYPVPMGHPGMMNAGYPGMVHPGMAHPGMAHSGMAHPGMQHPGMVHPAMMQQGMGYPGMQPGMPGGFPPGASGSPANPFPVARNYSGPGAPNPFAGMPQQAMQQPIQQASYVPSPAPVVPAQVTQLLAALRESMYPAQREWAANQLATFDWRAHPEIAPALIMAARMDPAATVRAGCVYGLSRMNAATQPVLETFHALRGDSDPRVRQEVQNALVRMGMTQ